MTLYTIVAEGRSDMLANGKSSYWVNNAITAETIYLHPASDGQFASYPMGARYGHQVEDTDGASIAPSGVTGIATWTLGTKSTYITLSAADVAVVYVPINTFGSTGALDAPVVTNLGTQTTLVRVNFKAVPLNGNPTPMLEIMQGSNSVFLTQANCSDLAATLNTIGST